MRSHNYREARIAIIILCLAIMPGCALMEWFQQRHEDSKEVATETVASEKGEKVAKLINTAIDKVVGKVAPGLKPPPTPDKDGDGGWGWFLTYGAAFILGLKPDEDEPKKKKSTKKKGKK